MANFVYALELVLMFKVWVKARVFKMSEVLDGAKLLSALGFYMKWLSDICIRGGMGSLLVKNHLILHIPDYIYCWGPPRGFDSANMEYSHKTQAKCLANLTQKQEDTFIPQTAARYIDSCIIKNVYWHFRIDLLLSNFIATETKEETKTHAVVPDF